jgi:small-conductance mechanosensitive channel
MIIVWCTLTAAYLAVLQANVDATTTESLFRLLQIPLIISLSLFAMRLGAGFIEVYNETRGRTSTSASLMRSLASSIIFLMGFLILLQALGISITPIITAFGIGGLAASLALQDTLSNAFSGLYIIFSKQTKPGDYVRLKVDERDQVEGYITDITWRSTKIRMMSGRMTVDTKPSYVIVPNSRMASDIVVLHNRLKRESELLLDVGVSYGNDLERVEQVTVQEAMSAVFDVVGREPDSLPLVRYRSFSPGAINLTIVVYGGETFDHHQVRHNLIKRLYQRYEREGIVLALADTSTSLSLSAAMAQYARPEREEDEYE